MWLIQTPVDELVLPTDTEARITLAGTAPAQHHIVRSRGLEPNGAQAALSAMTVRWDIRPWYEAASKIYFYGVSDLQAAVLDTVREHKYRAVSHATFPNPGKRKTDSTVQLSIVVPPAHFAQYESMVRFAMTLNTGTVLLTLPTPLTNSDELEDDATRTLIGAGTTSITKGLELSVSRASASAYSEADRREEQRASHSSPSSTENVDDENFADWFHFRRDDG